MNVTVRLSANVGMLFAEVPLVERFERAARAGFAAVESWWPLGVDLGAFAAAVRDAKVDLVLLNLYGGDLPAGDRGVAADLARSGEFREQVPVGLELAASLGCRTLHALIGKEQPDQDRGEQLRLGAENVRWAADLAARQGATLVVEPLNRWDNGPTLIQRVDDALDFIRAVGRDNVGIQLDAYHAHRTEGDAAAAAVRAGALIRHVQVADHPGRRYPGSGSIDLAAFVDALAEIRYGGYVGLEHLVPDGTEAALAWLPPTMRRGEVDPTALAAILRAHV